jgi:hypothetical protein
LIQRYPEQNFAAGEDSAVAPPRQWEMVIDARGTGSFGARAAAGV